MLSSLPTITTSRAAAPVLVVSHPVNFDRPGEEEHQQGLDVPDLVVVNRAE